MSRNKCGFTKCYFFQNNNNININKDKLIKQQDEQISITKNANKINKKY